MHRRCNSPHRGSNSPDNTFTSCIEAVASDVEDLTAKIEAVIDNKEDVTAHTTTDTIKPLSHPPRLPKKKMLKPFF